MKIDYERQPFYLQAIACTASAIATGCLWTRVYENRESFPLLVAAVATTVFLGFCLYCLSRHYHLHTRNLLFLLDAIENDDTSIHFNEADKNAETRLVNKALNKVASILYNVKINTAQREKYYELILNCVETGIVVLNDHGAVYQKNDEALRLLGLQVFTHIRQLECIDENLYRQLCSCRSGDKLRTAYYNERGTVDLAVRVSSIKVHDEHLRILALSDINNELNEKELDSWIRLIRVLTHEIMNAVTPITSLSDTLLHSCGQPTPEELHRSLQTISNTGKGLLAFVESYRKFTRIPTPEPTLFYVSEFIERMVELARHQYHDTDIRFQVHITPPDLILHADENLISQVVTNLLKNAVQAFQTLDKSTEKSNGTATQAMAETKEISIHAWCDDTEAIFITVANNGPVIPADIAEHIFVPFFTTKEGGSGIGLSISRQIMRLSGGSLTLRRIPQTTFILKFN